MNKNKVILLFLFVFSLNVYGQTKQDIIKTTRKQFQEIDTDTTLKKISLDSEEFLDHVPDGGGELVGFFRGDSIVKIVEWIGLSYGNKITEYYYKNNKLFFVFEKFDSFVEKNGELDHEKVNTSFEGRYYFNDEKLIEKKISGKKPLEDNSTDISTELQKEARENLQLLLNKRHK